MPLKAYVQRIASGTLFVIENSETRQTTRAFIDANLINSSTLGGIAKSLHANTEFSVAAINKTAETMNLTGQKQAAIQSLTASLASPVAEAIRIGRGRIAELEAMREKQLTSHKVDGTRAVAIAARVAGMKTADALKLVMSDLDVAVSVHQNMAIAGLPHEVLDVLEEFIQRSNLERTFSSQHSVRPILDRPFQTGADAEAVTVAAKSAIARHRAAREEVDALGRAVQTICDFAALATGKDRSLVFAELTAGVV